MNRRACPRLSELPLTDGASRRFCRFLGTQLGLPGTCILLWWHWPEAHGFVFHPLSVIIVGTSTACDLAYPFLLAYVRSTERVLPDGTVVVGDDMHEAAAAAGDKKRN